MAEKKVLVKVVTPERILFENKCDMVIMRTTEGDIGILPSHESLTATLAPGKMRIISGDNENIIAVLGGFVVVDNDVTTILSDRAELPEDIDRERALSAKERAEKRLKGTPGGDVDLRRAEYALRRALVRIDVSSYPLINNKIK